MSGNTTGSDQPAVSLVVTNYNGRILLRKYFPSIVRAAEQYQGESEIIVADDCSTDDGVDFIRTNYPGVRIVSMGKNSGFLKNANNGISAATNNIVILLNNDLEVDKGFIEPLARHLEDENVFSVTPKGILPRHGNATESFTRALFRDGMLDRIQIGIEQEDASCFYKPQPCIYACGG